MQRDRASEGYRSRFGAAQRIICLYPHPAPDAVGEINRLRQAAGVVPSCTAVKMVSKHVRLSEHDAHLHEARARARGMSFSDLVRTALAWHAGYEAGLETTLEGHAAPPAETSQSDEPR